MANRKSYQRQYYRKNTIDKLRKTIKRLEAMRERFLESPEGIAYRKRLRDEYAKQYRVKNFEKMRTYLKEYRAL
tara:strand:- start:1 stop:222 length:222 start_codon:yes stop_codon:yes gene_type:complete